MTATIDVVINGEPRQVANDLSVTGLLQILGIVTGRVAIERNLAILPKADWDQTRVAAGDRYEIVHLVGGG
jgi:thiamine biosynthesis protein ThiS